MTRRTVFIIAAMALLPLAVGCNTDAGLSPESSGGPAPAKTASRPASPRANTPATAGKTARGVELNEAERMAELIAYLKKKGYPLTQEDRRGRRYAYVIDKTADGFEAYTTFVVLPSNSNDLDNQRLYEAGKYGPPTFALRAVYNPHCKIAMFWPQIRCTSGVDCPPRLLRLQADDSDFITAFRAFRPREPVPK
jgi:hypothetical protein